MSLKQTNMIYFLSIDELDWDSFRNSKQRAIFYAILAYRIKRVCLRSGLFDTV